MNKEEIAKYQKEYYLKNKEGLNQYQKEYHKKYPWKRTMFNIKYRCENINAINYRDYGGRGIKCLITKEELEFLWFRDEAYNMKKPSIDRKENNGNYILDNCQYIERGKNSAERNKRVCSKSLLQFDLQGNFIKEWNSTREASRKLKIAQSNISLCCLGNINYSHAGGFIWKYKENINA